MGWYVQILPYVEQDAIYKIRDTTPGWASPPAMPKVMSNTPVKLFVCPSRRPAEVSPNGRAMQDYAAAIPGQPIDWHGGVLQLDRDGWLLHWGAGEWWYPDPFSIIVRLRVTNWSPLTFYHLKITFASINDGSSNVICLGEKFKRTRDYRQNTWHDDQGWVCGWDEDIIRSTHMSYMLDTNFPRNDGDWDDNCAKSFGSPHIAGMNALFGDGSVRTIEYGINATTFWLLGHRSDGRPIEVP